MAKYNLTPKKTFMPSLSFDWNEKTGELVSEQISFIGGYIDSRLTVEKTALLENLTVYTFTGGVTESKECLAVIFGGDYHLPDDLLKAYPVSGEMPETDGLITVY